MSTLDWLDYQTPAPSSHIHCPPASHGRLHHLTVVWTLKLSFLISYSFQVWCTDHHPESVRTTVAQSLKDLQTDYIDMLLKHWPMAYKVELSSYSRTETGQKYEDRARFKVYYAIPHSRGVFVLQMSIVLWRQSCWLSIKNLRFSHQIMLTRG